VKSTHWSDDSHALRRIEFVELAPLNHSRLTWKCAQK
jgi:hypothetical protein